MATIGYARVSTDGQSLDAQHELLTAAGCARIYAEKASGAKTDRPQLAKAVAILAAGDVLVVTRLDRLARSTLDLLATLHKVSERGAAFRSIADAWADTSTAHGRLLVTMLAGIAEFERELIRARTTEGRRRATERGQHMGRPEKLTHHQQREIAERLAQGATVRDLADSYAVHRATIDRLRRRPT